MALKGGENVKHALQLHPGHVGRVKVKQKWRSNTFYAQRRWMFHSGKVQSMLWMHRKWEKKYYLLHLCYLYLVYKCFIYGFWPILVLRWCTSTFLRCPECLQVINFLSCFLRCNQRCSAFLEVYFCTAVHLHEGNAQPLSAACPFWRNHSEHTRITQWIFRETRNLDSCLWRSKALQSFFPA